LGHWRLGIAASKKIGSAVKRNRIKRLIREFFRLHQKKISMSADIVVIPKKTRDIHKLKLQTVEQELTAAIHTIQKDLLSDLQAAAKNHQ
jgi:ribonuclease P protein component